MITKREPLHMDAFNEAGILSFDVHGPFSFQELKDEMIRALAHDLIPVVRRIKQAAEAEEEETNVVMDPAVISVSWTYKGVEFEARGTAEYVLRASREMLEALQ